PRGPLCREVPCEECLRSALAGKTWGHCYDPAPAAAGASGAKRRKKNWCVSCASASRGRPCVPLAPIVVPFACRLQEVMESDSTGQADLDRWRAGVWCALALA
ncbi:hypothetical protein KHU50_000256, partial [Colletotrichum sp. SAR 10_65]